MVDEKDRALSAKEWEDANFMAALLRLPTPVPMFDDGAVCPWCGALNPSLHLMDWNHCHECGRRFLFGYPPWDEDGTRPLSWVPFPSREWLMLGKRASLLDDWKPNERLKEIYAYWDRYRAEGDMDRRATHKPEDAVN